MWYSFHLYLNLLPITSIYLIFFSLEMQRVLVQTKVCYELCYSLWKETCDKPLKVATAKKSFPNVYIIDTTYFNECFLFHVIAGRHNFYTDLSLSRDLMNRHVAVFFETSALKEAALYTRYLHDDITMLLIPKVHNKVSSSYRYTNADLKNSLYVYVHMKTKLLTDFQICISAPLNLLIAFFYSFSLWMFHSFLLNGIFKTQKPKNSLEVCFY